MLICSRSGAIFYHKIAPGPAPDLIYTASPAPAPLLILYSITYITSSQFKHLSSENYQMLCCQNPQQLDKLEKVDPKRL